VLASTPARSAPELAAIGYWLLSFLVAGFCTADGDGLAIPVVLGAGPRGIDAVPVAPASGVLRCHPPSFAALSRLE
jgi:hypothetical protein